MSSSILDNPLIVFMGSLIAQSMAAYLGGASFTGGRASY